MDAEINPQLSRLLSQSEFVTLILRLYCYLSPVAILRSISPFDHNYSCLFDLFDRLFNKLFGILQACAGLVYKLLYGLHFFSLLNKCGYSFRYISFWCFLYINPHSPAKKYHLGFQFIQSKLYFFQLLIHISHYYIPLSILLQLN